MKIVLGGVFVMALLFAVPACADDGGKIGVPLPVNVRILDFETTKTLCASADAPDWCPEHLRVASVVDAAPAVTESSELQPLMISLEEREKRERIARVKDRLASAQNKM